MAWINRTGIQLTTILLVFFGVIAAGLIGVSTRWGPSAYGDSTGYIEVAHNLMVGNGPVQIKGSGKIMLLTTRPPFYSMALALFSLPGEPLIDAARILDVVLFALFVAGVGLAIYGMLHRPLVSLAASMFLLTSPTMVSVFSGAMSEPLFYVLGFSGLFLLIFYLQTGRRSFWWASAVLTGLSSVTRFTGATMIATGCLILLLFSSRSFIKRVKESLGYLGVSLLPFLAWAIYLRWMGTYPGQYSLPAAEALVTMLRSSARAFIEIFFNWLPWGAAYAAHHPNHHGLMIAILALFALIGLVACFYYAGRKGLVRSAHRVDFQMGVTFGALILIYVVFLLITYIVVLNPKPRLDERMLSPLLIAFLLSGIGFLIFALDSIKSRRIPASAPAGILLVFIIANSIPTVTYVKAMYAEGDGYTSRAWHQSAVISALKTLPPNVHIISDDIEAVMFFTFRPATRIPELESHTREPIGQAFGDDPNDSVQRMFRDHQAVLVLFNTAYWQFYDLYGSADTMKRLNAFTRGLYPYFKGSDGAIYYYSAP